MVLGSPQEMIKTQRLAEKKDEDNPGRYVLPVNGNS